MGNFNLKLELVAFFVASNLVFFSMGMLLPMLNFDVIGFVVSLSAGLLLVIMFGVAVFFVWMLMLVRKTNQALN